MTDLFTRDDVERIMEMWWPNKGGKTVMQELCRGYLTLWDRNEELEATLLVAEKLAIERHENPYRLEDRLK